jgi:hypothetical protein
MLLCKFHHASDVTVIKFNIVRGLTVSLPRGVYSKLTQGLPERYATVGLIIPVSQATIEGSMQRNKSSRG